MMERFGIGRAVIAPAPRQVAVDNRSGNRLMLRLVARYPEIISGLAVANPWYGKKAVATLRDFLGDGLVGAYFHPGRQGFHLTDEMVDPLVEVCADLGKNVYCHTGTPVCAMPFQLAELARRFPTVTFVMGSAGWSDFSGYDDIPAARQAANIMIETSCTTGARVAAIVRELGAGRVVFGSGYPRSMPGLEKNKVLRAGLPAGALEPVFRGNALRLWKIAS